MRQKRNQKRISVDYHCQVLDIKRLIFLLRDALFLLHHFITP